MKLPFLPVKLPALALTGLLLNRAASKKQFPISGLGLQCRNMGLGCMVALTWFTLPALGAGEDGRWDARFGLQGVANGTVTAMATADDGAVYMGGTFTTVSGVQTNFGALAANRIAKWDGIRWHILGDGLDGQVKTIAIKGTNVYVGGTFTNAGSVTVNRIARWNGHAWSALGSGVSGSPSPGIASSVNAIAFDGNDVVIGGNFVTAGGVTANAIARWDGLGWSDVGGGLGASQIVNSLAVRNGNIYAGGSFFVIQNVNGNISLIQNVARWDGVAWSAIGSGMNSAVNVLAFDGDALLAGGMFTTAGGVSASRIARWNGATWSALGAGVGGGIVGIDAVNALGIDDAGIVVGGYFDTAGGQPANAVARWDGVTWSPMGAGMLNVILTLTNRATVSALSVSGSNVFAGGAFSVAGDETASNMARWDGVRWSAIGLGIAGAYAFAPHDGAVYVGGNFTLAGGKAASGLARWDGAEWTVPPGSVLFGAAQGAIHAVAGHGTNLFVGGGFTSVGGIAATNIARWDGTSWSPVGGGLTGGAGAIVQALVVSADGVLYAGGVFTNAGGLAVRNVAAWDGTNWSSLGGGVRASLGGGGSVFALALLGNDLYVGGAFDTPVALLGRWDGNAWSAVGGGMNASVLALATHGSNLYAGGYFTQAGGNAAARIARWDGVSWSPLGDGIGNQATDYVRAIAVDDGVVYVGGAFTNAADKNIVALARWDGTEWSPLGEGLRDSGFMPQPNVQALAFINNALYVGGTFGLAGGHPSTAFAIYYPSGVVADMFITVTRQPNGDRLLVWNSEPGKTYEVRTTHQLGLAFTPLGDPVPSGGTSTSFTDSSAVLDAQFYLIMELP